MIFIEEVTDGQCKREIAIPSTRPQMLDSRPHPLTLAHHGGNNDSIERKRCAPEIPARRT